MRSIEGVAVAIGDFGKHRPSRKVHLSTVSESENPTAAY
jgi:hypothetical protein